MVGEAVVDIVRTDDGSVSEHPGGSAVNVAVALARLGREVALATSFADDANGRLVAAHLQAAGVGLANDPHALARTSTAMASLAEDGSARYEFDLDWRLNPLPDRPPVAMLHVCSLGAVLAPGAATTWELASRLRGEALVSYDLNARPEATGAGPDVVTAVERMAAVSDLVKASDEDLAALYPDRDIDDAARWLRSLGPAAVAVTRGDQGASWFGDGGRIDVPADPVGVVDTIGAGDTFSAAHARRPARAGRLGGRPRGPRRARAGPGHPPARARGARGSRDGLAGRRGPAVPLGARLRGCGPCGSGWTSPTTAPTTAAGRPSRTCRPSRARWRPRWRPLLRLPEVRVVCAGRTDTGVHARGQVVHVDLDAATLAGSSGRSKEPPLEALLRRLNGILPPDVRVRRVVEAPDGFDARFSPLWRRYAYRVADTPEAVDPLARGHVLAWSRPLDVVAMNRASELLVGQHDFASFCKQREGATTIRTLLELGWVREPCGLVVGRVRADAFCHSMVRSLVGCLLAVGEGRQPAEWAGELLRAQTRDPAVTVAHAHGLTLEEVGYPADEQLAARADQTRARRVARDG